LLDVFVDALIVALCSAAVLSQVWTFTAAMAHLRACLEIAAAASAEKRRYSLAIIYDEICRKEWPQKAARGKPVLAPCLPFILLRWYVQVTVTLTLMRFVSRKTRICWRGPG